MAAFRRRFGYRIHLGLPDAYAKYELLELELQDVPYKVSSAELTKLSSSKGHEDSPIDDFMRGLMSVRCDMLHGMWAAEYLRYSRSR